MLGGGGQRRLRGQQAARELQQAQERGVQRGGQGRAAVVRGQQCGLQRRERGAGVPGGGAGGGRGGGRRREVRGCELGGCWCEAGFGELRAEVRER